ncbi:UNVERIFIED_CONTAM: hypothetical protein GTU68_028087, partial [Idotea baltica]|nr:hypothetical protein [Idotea baltica]
AAQDRPPTPVTVVTLQAQDVTLTARLPGRVVAAEMAEIRPQVAGIIAERLFKEGADVTEGIPLYRIDPATYEAAVAQATAQVQLAEAQLVARNEATRNALEEAVASRDSAQASLAAARAQLAAAEIDLERTELRAPISGVIGRSLTTRGALVTAGQAEALAVIRRIDPVLVDVTQSAADLVTRRRNEQRSQSRSTDQTVRLFLADGSEYSETGQVTAADPNVDELTGVVTLRMTFANPHRFLLPG